MPQSQLTYIEHFLGGKLDTKAEREEKSGLDPCPQDIYNLFGGTGNQYRKEPKKHMHRVATGNTNGIYVLRRYWMCGVSSQM